MQQEAKPAAEKKKKNVKKTEEVDGCSKERKDKAKYAMKKHKRKATSGDTIMVCAIHNNSTGKQVAQLSSTVQPECSSIVGQMVLDLNESKRTLEDVIGELNTLKGSS